ncbi:hypothetical protein KUL42_10160 [Alteromonas sp. KUL42]|uniref:hypothetical protein n=1 Tax=Alteromonas sp. KUL42 TaxID=2480797 RepID=UPI0010359384|nr:hypothetical protein [Alteromonas sp. KUL42]TAP37802.1 hypothetical protein EYR97_05035 [Alteromonas sp. KUL42]GEA06255.1 hypothetical protein KUL42_10160 [Alteromonas sp. KUL42]
MDKKLSLLIKKLNELKDTVNNANIDARGFQAHGWNIVHLNKNQVIYLISNKISMLESYGNKSVSDGFANVIDDHIEKIESLNNTSKSYFTNNQQHLVHIIPVFLLTLQTIFSDIDHELFSYENLQDKKLLPKSLSARLRGVKNSIDRIEESSEGLKGKVKSINDAHEAAENLPTDLESLKEARAELLEMTSTAKKEFETTKKELSQLKDEAALMKNNAKNAALEIEKLKEIASKHENQASKLVEKCDDALQITTTQGLAAGFDQKAKELKSSIWIWIFALLIALGSGAWLGAERVNEFTKVLGEQLTAGQAILHTIMAIFSIGGPLWLAWLATQQINQRFKLSEDYSYKATVAKSFTGFKKFAERFSPDTEERLFNSTLDRFDEMPLRLINGKDYNSPWHEFIDSEAFKNATKAFPNLVTEAGKFASRTKLKEKPKPQKDSNIDKPKLEE